MKLIGLAGGEPTPFDGQYLVHYDPNTPGMDPLGQPMLATLVTTPDKTKARRFASFSELHSCWTQVVAAQPVRPDGQPNRPLTSFTMTTEPA